MLDVVANPTIGYALLLLILIISIAALRAFGVPFGPIHARLSERWILGVPWGTVIVVGMLLGVYLFVQRAYWDWYRPIIVAYTAVSMTDPTGWMFAGFAHTSPGHLRGNVTSTIVFGPIVEWIWRHKPVETGRSAGPDWRRNPRIRAFVLFPLGVGVIGVTAALFSWGPVIGFSVAVYALIGIALVHYPVITLAALVARQAVRVLWRTWTDPLVLTETTIRAVRPGWYGTAVQGHLVGLLLGVAIGLVALRYRGRRPSPGRLWLASALTGFYLALWALWWIIGPEQFVLFRVVGVALVFAVATLIVASVYGTRRPVGDTSVNGQTIAISILLLAVLGMGAVGIGLNFATAESPDLEPAVTVEDYEIYYGEEIPDGMINIVEFEAIGLTTDVETSGVVVYSEDRNVWRQPISQRDLEARGTDRFTVGGIGWGEQIRVERVGWQPTGSSPVYQIQIADSDGWNHAFASDPGVAQVRISDRQFAIVPEDGVFLVAVVYDEEVEWREMPSPGENVTAHGVELHRYDDALVAAYDGTEVTIATREQYG